MFAASGTTLGVAAAVYAASLFRSPGRRAALSLLALAVLLALMLALDLHLRVPMGDYRNYVEDRGHFSDYFGAGEVTFQNHLGATLVRAFDALAGSTQTSPADAFDWLARLIAVVFVVGLVALGFHQRWSARAVRTIAIAVAAPATVLLFGYHEFGHLPLALAAVALPLGLIGLERHRAGLVSLAAALLGIGAALHAFGLVALGFLVVTAAAYLLGDREARAAYGLRRLWEPVAAGLAAWLVWIPPYVSVLDQDIATSHAAGFPLRPLLHARFDAEVNRVDRPILSWDVLEELGYEACVVGVGLLLLLALVRDPLRRAVLIGSVPVLAFLVLFWPIQGLGMDTDLVVATFPPLYALAWLAARSRLATLGALAILLVGHLGLAAILTTRFVVE